MNIHDPKFLDCDGFRNVTNLSESQQRELLHAEDPRGRVWAAWALGLRFSTGISAELRESIGTEPIAGVRRHLLVMLAGFGEVDIVAALARHDPDDYVRKTAARFVGELAVNHPDAFAVAERLLRDGSADVRAALIDGLPDAVPARIATLLDSARGDECERVREAMARRDAAQSDVDTLRRTASTDANSVVRRGALRALVAQLGAGAALEPLNAAQRRRAIGDLRAAGVTVPFEEIAGLEPGPGFLDVLELAELGVGGRIWLLGLVSLPIRDYWRRVGLAYVDVDRIEAGEERDAMEQFLRAVQDSLRAGEPDAEEAEGALTEWGNWTPLEAQRRELLETLMTKLTA